MKAEPWCVVRYFGLIKVTAGQKAENVIFRTETCTLENILAELCHRHGEQFTSELFGPEGRLSRNIHILINGANSAEMSGLDTAVPAEARVDILSIAAFSGG